MKRSLAVAGLILTVIAGVLIVQQVSRNRRYLQLVEAGQRALDSANSYLAIEAFSGALTLRPNSMVAYYHRGEAYRAQSRQEEAIRDFRAALRLAPDAAQPLIALGDLYDATDPAQAAQWYGQAARLQSADPILLYKLALARYRAGTPAEAAEPLKQALARNDSLAEAHYLLGLVYRDTQRPGDAIAALERAVKLAPALLAPREELVELYRSAGRPADEMTQLRALEALDDAPERIVHVALAQARAQRFAAALETLNASRNASSDSRVLLAVGRVYLARAEQDGDRAAVAGALAALEKALGGTARRGEGLTLFGRALMLAGNFDRAERILRDAVATSPVDPEAFEYLAEAADRLSHFLEARDALIALEALQGDTASPDRRGARAQRIGILSLRANDAITAADYLAQAIEEGRRDAPTFAQLAQARLQAGDPTGAERAVAQGLDVDPRNSELLRLGRRLRTH
jgi:tetratricopeptide (TPR) repeat protein